MTEYNDEIDQAAVAAREYLGINTHSIGKLALALSKAQGMMKAAIKDAENPAFKRDNVASKYVDLAAAWEACREALSKNELAVIQQVHGGPDPVSVTTTLVHSSGESISSTMTGKPTKPDVQGIGSTVTYLRRYSLMAMVGIAAEDDDGNAASGKTVIPQAKNTPEAVAKEAGRVQEAKTNKNILLNLPSGEAKPFMSMTAYLDAFDTELSNTDDQPAFFDLNSSTLGELQAKAVAAKNKQGDAIAARITEIYDRIRAFDLDPLKGA